MSIRDFWKTIFDQMKHLWLLYSMCVCFCVKNQIGFLTNSNEIFGLKLAGKCLDFGQFYQGAWNIVEFSFIRILFCLTILYHIRQCSKNIHKNRLTFANRFKMKSSSLNLFGNIPNENFCLNTACTSEMKRVCYSSVCPAETAKLGDRPMETEAGRQSPSFC